MQLGRISMPITANHAPALKSFGVKLLNGGSGTPMDDVKDSKVIGYRECLKNHAASMGGHATDGCGEFMASGAQGTADALICAACECHRNFHRREVEAPSCDCEHISNYDNSGSIPVILPLRATPGPSSGMVVASTHAPVIVTSFSEIENREGAGYVSSPSAIRKRVRTKFSAEQKKRMLSIAEKLDWKIQKHEEAEVKQFCAEIGVSCRVLKVWMHNNRHTLREKTVREEILLI
ncbi:hypothetical protein O6H91_01G049700 [Diphasiastrum complanatum]|uniref:Uncharacterized protein n=1 Tax=Diphasiastrum complanatum TaxID=34168 RepID=A0ACC2EQM6_DIPCM|nr:hypothetical protein O6H91_Y243100 [Diphasiastrum complanatum]KAJ7568809.1 hypothetical protein O6H91_01G049700 [Diphasiastrum complanatum]